MLSVQQQCFLFWRFLGEPFALFLVGGVTFMPFSSLVGYDWWGGMWYVVITSRCSLLILRFTFIIWCDIRRFLTMLTYYTTANADFRHEKKKHSPKQLPCSHAHRSLSNAMWLKHQHSNSYVGSAQIDSGGGVQKKQKLNTAARWVQSELILSPFTKKTPKLNLPVTSFDLVLLCINYTYAMHALILFTNKRKRNINKERKNVNVRTDPNKTIAKMHSVQTKELHEYLEPEKYSFLTVLTTSSPEGPCELATSNTKGTSTKWREKAKTISFFWAIFSLLRIWNWLTVWLCILVWFVKC